jgi:hypothetical protein
MRCSPDIARPVRRCPDRLRCGLVTDAAEGPAVRIAAMMTFLASAQLLERLARAYRALMPRACCWRCGSRTR